MNYALKLEGLNLYLTNEQSLTGVRYTENIKRAMIFDDKVDNPEIKKGIWNAAAKLQHNNSDVCFEVIYKNKNMETIVKRQGYRSPKNGHLGVYTLCSGPDPSGPVPGERLIIVIYDEDDNIVRRLEQVKGDCIDPGYVDFFNSHKCKPSVHDFHMVDIDKDGNRTILATHHTPQAAVSWLQVNCPKWVKEHGIEQPIK